MVLPEKLRKHILVMVLVKLDYSIHLAIDGIDMRLLQLISGINVIILQILHMIFNINMYQMGDLQVEQ